MADRFCQDGDEQRAIPEYNDYQIWAELSYGDSGKFQLKNYEIGNYMLEDTVEVEAVILPMGAESYNHALMELIRTDTGGK